MDHVMRLINELEQMVDESKGRVFTSKVSIDKEDIYDIIEQMKKRLPEDIKECKIIVQQRNAILNDAQKDAEAITREAEEKMIKLIDEHEITKAAYAQSAEIIENAKMNAREMRIGATEYADGILGTAEARLKEMQEKLREESIAIDSFLSKTLNVLYENRGELRGVDR